MNALEIAENQVNGTQYIDIKTDNNEMKEEVMIVCKDENQKKKKRCCALS
jgi:hypothetical protein